MPNHIPPLEVSDEIKKVIFDDIKENANRHPVLMVRCPHSHLTDDLVSPI
jgi:hypothetical protein